MNVAAEPLEGEEEVEFRDERSSDRMINSASSITISMLSSLRPQV